MKRSVYIGWDPREADAYIVARRTARRNVIHTTTVRGIVLDDMRERGLYERPTSAKDGRLWDDISEAPMSTEFAISRFLTPILAGSGAALFMDADMLVRASLEPLFQLVKQDPSKAVWCVKHDHKPSRKTKMDGQEQTRYARKNWSSVMLFNVDHPSNAKLTVEMINTVPGRDLHAFCWLDDDEIGEVPAAWNFLVGHTKEDVDPGIVHFTDGIPSMPGYEDCAFADEWRAALRKGVA